MSNRPVAGAGLMNGYENLTSQWVHDDHDGDI